VPFSPWDSSGGRPPCRGVVGFLWGSQKPLTGPADPTWSTRYRNSRGLMTTFRVTQRHRYALPVRGNFARIAESLRLSAIRDRRRVERISPRSARLQRAGPKGPFQFIGRFTLTIEVAIRNHLSNRCRRAATGCPAVRLAAVAARRSYCQRVWLPCGTCDRGGDDIRGVPVQAAAGALVPHSGSRISMRGGFLHVAQRDPGIETGRERFTNHAEWVSLTTGRQG
jgi:hypothetical protein